MSFLTTMGIRKMIKMLLQLLTLIRKFAPFFNVAYVFPGISAVEFFAPLRVCEKNFILKMYPSNHFSLWIFHVSQQKLFIESKARLEIPWRRRQSLNNKQYQIKHNVHMRLRNQEINLAMSYWMDSTTFILPNIILKYF